MPSIPSKPTSNLTLAGSAQTVADATTPRTTTTTTADGSGSTATGGWQTRTGGRPFKLPDGVAQVSVAPAVRQATGSAAKSVRIADVLQNYGWPLDGWQAKFLLAADTAHKSTRKVGQPGDGQLSVAELRDFAYHPDGGKYLTSLAIDQVVKQAGAADHKVDAFPEPWMNVVAQAASKLAGRTDGQVNAAQLTAYGAALAKGAVPEGGASWVTNQRVQVLYHALARYTQESDAMDSPNKLRSTELIWPAMALAYDPDNNVAITASNTYFASDARYSFKTERTDNFYSALPGGIDENVFVGPSTQNGRTWFDFTGFQRSHDTYDKGHLLANLNFNDPVDRATSFATQNMHAQVPASNSGVWLNKVEQATRDAVVACNGRAVDVTGVLFADKDLKPLPADQIPWIAGKKGTGHKGDLPADRIPVPTHSWKAVLMQTGDDPPKFSAKVYIVENRMDLDRNSEPKVVSIKEMERILGGNFKLFQDLPKDIRAKIENDPNATFQPRRAVNFIAFNDEDRGTEQA